MNGINRVSPAALLIEVGSGDGLLGLSFEKVVESLLFVGHGVNCQALDMHFSLRIVLDRDTRAMLLSWLLTEEIEERLVVDLEVTDRYCDFLVIVRANLLENLRYSSWNDTSVLEIGRRSIHGEGLSCSSLTIAHDGSVIAAGYRLYYVFGAVVKEVFLRCIVHELVKFEFPRFLSVINMASVRILWDMYTHSLKQKITAISKRWLN